MQWFGGSEKTFPWSRLDAPHNPLEYKEPSMLGQRPRQGGYMAVSSRHCMPFRLCVELVTREAECEKAAGWED